jgi:hypothetical protein
MRRSQRYHLASADASGARGEFRDDCRKPQLCGTAISASFDDRTLGDAL